ncbi:amidase [Alcaligenes endophyticus]|uniref:Amidase n=1 Tax=Alcaligenes endophyticus TaxID=1929088 RepID=A0ABT8ELW1_9BURK|nr:amidase [Alcaligenes endophyticus]MCX5591128.1 amidase [Alcaligenes endophyticus]MDN4122294.1 amidase [Alcaligenes endophyticus]
MQHPTIEALEAHDKQIRAWSYLPQTIEPPSEGPLNGLTFGVKDVIDVRGMPTCYGANFPNKAPALFDAACVARLKMAGATVLGKTVTAEFAYKAPGPTRNPLNLAHSPGGSSSGSAAAVAAYMADFSLGTQTGGSMMRPAAFTGLLGFKPSFGIVHRAGMFLLCDTLDTLGWFTRDISTMRAVSQVLLPMPAHASMPSHRIAMMSLSHLHAVHPAFEQIFESFEAQASKVGYECIQIENDEQAHELLTLHGQIMHYEMAQALLPVWQACDDALRAETINDIKTGLAIPSSDYQQWQTRRRDLQIQWAERYAQYDAIVTPASTGPAPLGIQSTGSSILNRIWSLLGWPCMNMPYGQANGLPLGLQVVGRPHQDKNLLELLDVLVQQASN